VNSVRKSNSDELNELQREHRKRKKEIVEDQEQDIANLRDKYTQQKADLEKNGEAVVNHIKAESRKNFEALSQENEDRLRAEKARGQRETETYKKYADSNRKVLDSQITEKEVQASERLKELSEREQQKQKDFQKISQKSLQSQQEKLTEASKEANAEIGNIYSQSSEKKKELQQKSSEELKKVQDQYKQTMQQTSQERQATLDKQRAESYKTLQEIQTSNEQRIRGEQSRGENQLNTVRQKFKAETEKTQVTGQDKIDRTREENQRKLDAAVIKGRDQQEKVYKESEEHIRKVSSEGERKVNEKKQETDTKLTRQEAQFKYETEMQRKQYENQQAELHDNYQKHFAENKETYQANLKRQREQFQSNYRNTGTAQKESLHVQNELFLRELNQLRQKQLMETKKYEGKEDDPFFKIQNRGSRLSEGSQMYVLRTYLPEADKDSVKVRVQGDKAIVSGARSFNDKLQDDNKKVSTSSYQTFHEEFKFDHPVAEKAIYQQRDGDFVDFVIPKIGFVNKKA
jgi:hypothetical protein